MKKIVRGFAGGLALTQMLTPFAIALESSENIKITLTDNILVKGNKLVGAKNGKIKLESKKTDISKLFVVKEEIYNKYLSDLATSDEPDKLKESFVLEHSLKGNEYSFKDDGIYVFGFIEEEKIKEEIENEDGTTEDIEKVNYTISKDQVVTYSETKFNPSLDLDIVGANKLIDSVYKFSNELVLTSKVESDTKTEGKIFIVEKGEEFDRDSSKFQRFNPETDEKVKLQNLPIDKEFKVFVLITDEVGNEFIKTSSTYEKLDIQTTVPVSKDIWSKDKHTVKVDLSKLDKKDIDSVSIDILNKGSKIDTIDSTASIGSIETINLNDIKENIGGNVSIRVNLKTVLGTDSKETTFYIDDTAPKLVESSFNAKGALVNKHGDLYLEEPLVLDILVSDKEEGKETSGLDYLQIEHRTQDKVDVLKKTNKENLSINLPENLTGELYIVAEDKYGNKLEQKVEPLRIEGKTRPDYKYKLVKGDTKVTLEDKKVLSDKYFSNKENSDLYGMEFTVKIDTPDLDEIILNVNDVKTVISSDRVKDGLLTITDDDIKTQRMSATDKLKIDIEVTDFTSKKDNLTLFEGTIDSIAPIVTIGSTDLDNYEVIDGVLYVKEDKIISIDIKDEQTGIQSKTLNGKDFNRNSIKLSELTSSTRLEVVDNAGNKTIKTIKDFINVDEQFSSVKIVDENLTITNTTKNEIIEGYYKDLEILSFDLESNDSLLKEVKYEVLDKNGDKKKGSTITVDPVDKKHRLQIYIGDIELENGYAEVNIETTSILGTIETKTFKINFDNTNPTIKETKIENGIEFSDDLVFINGYKTNINVTLEDEETFVEKVILEYKEDLSDTWKEVQTKTLSKDNQTTNFEIKDSGFYKITVVDLVGHKTEKELEQVIFDATVPQIEISKGLENVTIINDENWFVNKPTFEFDISDDNLKDMEVFINDKKVDTVKFKSNETEYKYILSPENVDLFKENDKNTIEVVVKDKSKNVSKEKIEFTLDNKGPNISDTIKVIQGIENDYGITDKEKVVLKFNIEDLGSGIDKVMLNDKYEVVNGEVTLLEPLRRLNIKATDKLGNISEKVFDVNILIDNEKPETSIDLKDKEPTVIDKKEWLKEPTDFIFKASDASGLKNIKIKANGNVVNSVDKFPVLTLNQTFNIKFEQVEKYVKDNKLDLEFEVEDLTGNKSYMKKTYYVDLEGPEDLMAIYNKELNVFPYGVFSNKPIDITLHAKDKGVGLDSMFANGTILENNKLVISEENLEGHSFYIQAKDKLGHMSEVKNLNELNDMTKDSQNRYYIDSIDPIVTTEFIKDTVKEVNKDGKTWLSDDVDYIVNVEDNLSIAEVLIKVNGKEVRKFNALGMTKNKQFTLNTEDYNKDDYKFEVETIVKDSAGNETSKKDIVYIDKEPPIDVRIDYSDNIVIRDYGIYSKDAVNVSIYAKDEGVGFSHFLVNGVKQDDLLEITDDASDYRIIGVDLLGNQTKEFKLKDLNDKTSELEDGDNNIIIDNIKPVIKETKRKADFTDNSNIEWFNSNIDYGLTITDDKSLHSYTVKINGKEVDKETYTTASNVLKNLNYNTKDFIDKEGKFEIEVTVEDSAMNKQTFKDTIYIDTEAPTDVKTNFDKVRIHDYGVFSKEPIKTEITAKDKGSGVKNIYLNGVVLKDNMLEITNDLYNPLIVVSDNVGNETKQLPLNSLDSKTTKTDNIFIVDNVKPIIDIKKPKAIYNEKWYNKDIDFNINVKDNKALDKINVKVNNKIVKTFDAKEIIREKDFTISTKDYTPGARGSYQVQVDVIDAAGNENSLKETVYIDKEAPVNLKASVSGKDVNIYDYGIFSKAPFEVQLSADDKDGSGLSHFNINGVRNEKGTFKISENTKSIMVSAEDNVNNKTKEIPLNKLDGDLSKNENNHFYIDNIKPNINLKNNTSSKPDYQNASQKWYNKHQNFTVDVKDNLSLREVKIKINGKEEVKVFGNKNGLETDYSYSFNTRDYINKIDGRDVGGKVTIEVLVTDSAGNTSKTTEELYIDNVKPTVKKFNFLSDGIKEGVQTNGNADYGFYFKTSTDVELDLTDYITVNGTEYKQGNYSSGLARVDYVLKNTNGQNISRSTSNIINGNKVIITVPIDFKGTIEAIAYDNVNHASNSNSPSGVITESSNWHINSSRIDLNEPNTPYKDRTGKKLYNKDTSIGLFAKQSSSGIRQIKWGIDDKTIETVSVDNKGNISNGRFKGQKLDRNLITEITSSLLVSENRNDIKIWTEVTSRTGRISKRDTSISIDKDAPIIDVTYNTTKDKYYNTDRVANITIKERNFNPDDVKITGKAGTLGTWRNNGDVWTNTMTFSQDGVYKWGLEYTDMAGNQGKPYNSEEFVIDKTKPIMKLTFDNNNKLNGKYYDKGRVGTITITERNFDSSKFTIKGGTISGFRSNGDTHTATVVFNKDGVYSLDLGFTDLAGNKAEDIHVDEFVIDTTKPKTNLLGVSKGQIFYDGINIRFNVSDTNLDVKNSIFTLVNRTTNKQIPLTGSMSNGVISLTGLKNIKENDGVYDLHYTVVDLAGNKVTEDVRFYVNRFGSNFEVDSVDYIGKYVKSLEKDVVIKELSLVKLKDIEITVFKDGTKIEVPKDKIQIKETQLKDGSYSYVYTIDKDFFDEGSFKVEVVSKDINDKTNDTRKTDLEFIVDKTKPTIIVGLDEDELYFTPEKDVIIDISDNYGLDNYKILLNGEEVTGEKISEGKIKITIPATNTKQNLKVVAEDKAGNIEEKEVNFYVTTSNWLQFKNSNFFTATISGLVGLIMLMFFLIFKRKEEEAEEEAQLEAETNAQNEDKEE